MKSAGERFIFWLVAALIVVSSVYGIFRAVSGPGNIPVPGELSDQDWIKGNPESKIILIEYSDFQCSACSGFHKTMNSILAEFGSHVQYAFRHFPLNIHDKSHLSAQAAEAAGIQGKFFEMGDLLFENQSAWTYLSSSDAENQFISYAGDLELDQKKFIEDMHSKEVKNLVEAELESARDARLPGTPSIFLNGVKISTPRSIEDFRTLIREAIESS